MLKKQNKIKLLQLDGIPVFGRLTVPIFGKLPGAPIFVIFGALPTPHKIY